MFSLYLIRTIARTVFILLFLLSVQYNPYAITLKGLIIVAEAGSKSSGNEAIREIREGLELKGMTKAEVVAALGEPWEKDTTPEKARHTEKWIYSCDTEKGINVGTFYNTTNEL